MRWPPQGTTHASSPTTPWSHEGGDRHGPVWVQRGERRLGAGGSRRRECGGGELKGEDHNISGFARLAQMGDSRWRECGGRENTTRYGAVEAGSFFSQGMWELLEADTVLFTPLFLSAGHDPAPAGDSLNQH
jgi:hypothetical protein